MEKRGNELEALELGRRFPVGRRCRSLQRNRCRLIAGTAKQAERRGQPDPNMPTQHKQRVSLAKAINVGKRVGEGSGRDKATCHAAP